MNRRAWLLFAGVSLFWGIPYLFIKIAVTELSAPVIVAARCAIAVAILLPVAIASGALKQLKGKTVPVLVLSVVHIAAPFLLITYGEQHITSSLTALLIAAQPLMVALLALKFDASEKLSGRGMAGLGVGLFGVAVVVGFDFGGDRLGLLGAGMVLLAAFGYAVAVLIVKRYLKGVAPVGVVTSTMGVSTVLIAPLAIATAPVAMPSLKVTGSVVILGVFCSAIAMLLFYRLIAVAGAGRASLINYVTPAVAVALGVAVLSEPLRPTTALGAVLIIAGSWFATRKPAPATAPATAATPATSPAAAQLAATAEPAAASAPLAGAAQPAVVR